MPANSLAAEMLIAGQKRQAQQRREASTSPVAPASAQGLLSGTGLRVGYHDQNVSVLLSGAEMSDMVEFSNYLSSRMGRISKSAAIMRFALSTMLTRFHSSEAERELLIQDFIQAQQDVTAVRREYRRAKAVASLNAGTS